MDETAEDIERLQALIDASYAAAGPHLLEIHTPERRLSAAAVCERLTGMTLLTLATVTRDGRPLTGPVDGIFYRGALHFSSGARSVRFRHIARNPAVSATHLPGEELAVTVHGRALPIDFDAPEHAGFRACVTGIYLPKYGDAFWELMNDPDNTASYVRIEAERMYAFAL